MGTVITVVFVLWLAWYLGRPYRMSRAQAALAAKHRADIDKELAAITAKVALMEEARAQDKIILTDALNREARAIAALKAVLSLHQVPASAIEIIMRNVNNEEEGDL